MTQRNRGRSRSFRRFGRGRSKTSWLQSAFEFAVTAAAGPILFSDLTPPPMRDAVGSTEGSATVRRLIFNGSYTPAVNEDTGIRMCLGVYVASHEAFAQVALSDPCSDEGQDWYYWTQRTVASVNGLQWDVDIRTARRLRAGYKLILVVNNQLNEVASTLNLSIRSLWTQEV